jgi:hypothetical protein
MPPKLQIKGKLGRIKSFEISREIIFKSKKEMLNFIENYGFQNRERLLIIRYDKVWIVSKH